MPRRPQRARHSTRKLDAERHLVQVQHQLMSGIYVTPEAGRVSLRYHALRHAFASMLIAGGCSVKAVQLALGHASAATTLNLYAHMWPGDDDRIRHAVDRAFGSDAEDQLRTESEAQ